MLNILKAIIKGICVSVIVLILAAFAIIACIGIGYAIAPEVAAAGLVLIPIVGIVVLLILALKALLKW